MNETLEQLARDVAEVTQAELPAMLGAQAPTLQAEAMAGAQNEAFYLIGLIGGKEVGKSAIVNALVGAPITASTCFGPGTEHVIAYVHEEQAAPVRAMLEREAPRQFEIVTHTAAKLHRQVLLDLPDIDSVYDAHVELTQRMLRHMLFPIWVQSIEKYADRKPQELLSAVAAGNDAENFLFVLNKADQLAKARTDGNDGDAIKDLRGDYAKRIARVLGRAQPPTVFVVSAQQPDQFDFPSLREKLAQQKTAAVVKQSIELATKRRDRSMLQWLDERQLPQRVQRLKRLQAEAQDLVSARLSGPLLERAVPAIMDDPSHRAVMTDEAMAARVARWPLVNVLHTLMWPITTIWRQNIAGASAASLVAVHTESEGRSLSASIQALFAMLQQTHPAIAELYRGEKLWDVAPAEAAVRDLRDAMVAALEAQRAEAIRRIARRGIISPIVRWTLTIGAILWFPIAQPILELLLHNSLTHTLRGAALLAVQLFGAAYLLRSAGFLIIWFVFLWLALRWTTQSRVRKLLERWRRIDGGEPSLNLASAIITWADELIDPIQIAVLREESLEKKIAQFKQGIA